MKKDSQNDPIEVSLGKRGGEPVFRGTRIPISLRFQFPGEHEVVTAHYQGWAGYDDDELLAAAEEAFAVFVTLDTNLAYQ